MNRRSFFKLLASAAAAVGIGRKAGSSPSTEPYVTVDEADRYMRGGIVKGPCWPAGETRGEFLYPYPCRAEFREPTCCGVPIVYPEDVKTIETCRTKFELPPVLPRHEAKRVASDSTYTAWLKVQPDHVRRAILGRDVDRHELDALDHARRFIDGRYRGKWRG